MKNISKIEKEYIRKIRDELITLAGVPLEDQTDEICRVAVAHNPWNIEYVGNKTTEICALAVNGSPWTIQHLKESEQSEGLCLKAVQASHMCLQHVINQTEEMCLIAVRSSPISIIHVKNQTEEICLEIVRQQGILLGKVEEQTEEICLAAVGQSGAALMFVRKQTEEIQKVALENNIMALAYVDVGIYKYNEEQIIKAYNGWPMNAKRAGALADKIAEILVKFNDDEGLIRVVSKDMLGMFSDDGFINLSENLIAIKQKVNMLLASDDKIKESESNNTKKKLV